MSIGKKLASGLDANIRELRTILGTDQNFDVLVRELELGRKRSFCFLLTGS